MEQKKPANPERPMSDWLPKLTSKGATQKLNREDFREDLSASLSRALSDSREELSIWLEGTFLKRLEETLDDKFAAQIKRLQSVAKDGRPLKHNRSREEAIGRISINSSRQNESSRERQHIQNMKKRGRGMGGITTIFGNPAIGREQRRSDGWAVTPSGTSSIPRGGAHDVQSAGAHEVQSAIVSAPSAPVAKVKSGGGGLISSVGSVGSAVGTVGQAALGTASSTLGTALSMTKNATQKATTIVSRFGFPTRKSETPDLVPLEEEYSYISFREGSDENECNPIPDSPSSNAFEVRFSMDQRKPSIQSQSYALLAASHDGSFIDGDSNQSRGENPLAVEDGTGTNGSADDKEEHKRFTNSIAKPVRNNRGSEFVGGQYEWLTEHVAEDDDANSLGFKSWAHRFARSSTFQYATGTVILLNAVSLGLQTDYMARHWTEDVPIEYDIFDSFSCLYFFIELWLRIYVVGNTAFAWLTRLEYISRLGEDKAILVVMRGSRLLRIMRFFRMLSVFAELRMLVVSLRYSIRSLFWSVVMVFLLVFMTSVYLTQLVTNYKVRSPSKKEELHELVRYYGTLDRSLLSMYEAISEGIHWGELVHPLQEHCGKWISICFSLYMAFMIFAMLNVITGRLCECSIEVAKEDRKKVLLNEMVTLFKDFDENCDGTVSRQEFLAQMANPKMQDFLKAVDLDEEAAITLFDVLNEDNEGKLQAKEFVKGCARINGPAKATDIARMSRQWEDHADYVEEMLCRIFESLMPVGDGGGHTSDGEEVEGEAEQQRQSEVTSEFPWGVGRSVASSIAE